MKGMIVYKKARGVSRRMIREYHQSMSPENMNLRSIPGKKSFVARLKVSILCQLYAVCFNCRISSDFN